MFRRLQFGAPEFRRVQCLANRDFFFRYLLDILWNGCYLCLGQNSLLTQICFNSIVEEIKSRLRSGSAECFVFKVAIQKFKDQGIENYNFACCFVWVWNLVVDIVGGKERKGTVFEDMVLRRIFRPRRDEVTKDLRRLHNEELNDLYSSPIIVRVIKSRRMRWAGHVARIG